VRIITTSTSSDRLMPDEAEQYDAHFTSFKRCLRRLKTRCLMTDENKDKPAEGEEPTTGEPEGEAPTGDNPEATPEGDNPEGGEGGDTPEGGEEPDKKDEPSKDDAKLDEEIEKERNRTPDQERAQGAFKKRSDKREQDGDDSDDDGDKPVTVKDMKSMRDEWRSEFQREALEDRARNIGKTFGGSDKEVDLMIAKWKNRQFPSDMPLQEQIEEMYGAVHAKRLIGERNEALRALKGKQGVNTNASASHQEKPKVGEPKISPADAQAIKLAGFSWNGTSKRYEKKLPNGNVLIRDSKTKKVSLVKLQVK